MLKFLNKVPHLRRKKCLSPLIKNKSFRSIFQIVVLFVKLFQDEEITRYKRRLEKGLQCTTLPKTNEEKLKILKNLENFLTSPS